MAPPDWAYHADNFEPPPDEELVCSVCRAVFCDPVQCPCNHVFCRTCIFRWLDRNRNCPICRKRASKYSVQEVVPLIKNMIMKLTMHCHNKVRGCMDKFTLESFESHLKVCLYEMVRCENCSCHQEMLRKDIQDHELGCPHRSITCEMCSLKISSVEPQKHNCIQELKQILAEKDVIIERKNQEIKKLQREIKTLKDTVRDSSDMSSIEGLSSTDIMIDLSSIPPLSPVTSFITDSESDDDDDDDSSVWLEPPDTPEATESYRQMNEESINGYDQIDDSVEYPRSSSPFHRDDPIVDTSESTFDEEPMRRPPKRRHPTQTLDSTDEDQDLEIPSLPSPKRTWRLFLNDETAEAIPRSVVSDQEAAGPSQGPTDIAESSRNRYSPLLNSRAPTKLRPRLRRSTAEQDLVTANTTTTAQRNSSPVFERTLDLLERYSLDSDPEWLPELSRLSATDTESNVHDGLRLFDGLITSSDESSMSGEESSDGSYEDAPTGTGDLLFSLCNSSSSSDEDPEWHPFGKTRN